MIRKMKFYFTVILCLETILINAQVSKIPDSLYNIKYSEEAQLLFEKQIFEASNSSEANEIIYEKALFFKKTMHFEKAIETLHRIDENSLNDSAKFIHLYQLSLLYYLTNNFAEAELNLNKIKYFIPTNSYDNKLFLLEVLNLNKMNRWQEAKQLLIENTKKDIDSNLINKIYKEALNHKPKSSSKALYLQTFLPGAGQFYIDKKLHGTINALLILSGLGWGVYNVYNGYYVTSVISGFFISYIFYDGGKRYTENNVIKYNVKKENALNAKLNKEIINLVK